MYINHIRIMLVITHYGHHDPAVHFPAVLCSANYLQCRLDTYQKLKTTFRERKVLSSNLVVWCATDRLLQTICYLLCIMVIKGIQ